MAKSPPETSSPDSPWVSDMTLGNLFGMVLDSLPDQTNPDQNPESNISDEPPHIAGLSFQRLLGRGGFAHVWLAHDRALNKHVAVKVLYRNASSPDAVRRFKNEIASLARLSHHSIARIFSSGLTADQRPFIVMEYVAGEPIDAFCHHHKLSTKQILSLLIECCSALEFAHSCEIIHRDIKPANILVFQDDSQNLRLRLIDFGIAKDYNNLSDTQVFYTQANQILGTPAFMAPEHASPDTLPTWQSDVFAIGALLYLLLTGYTPYQSAPNSAVTVSDLAKFAKRTFPSPSRKIRHCPHPAARRLWRPKSLDAICSAAIQTDRRFRYPDIKSLRLDLEACLSCSSPRNIPKIPWSLTCNRYLLQHKTIIPVASISLALAIGSAIFIAGHFAQPISETEPDLAQPFQHSSQARTALIARATASYQDAIAHQEKRNYFEALDSLRESISLNPNFPAAAFSLAMLYCYAQVPVITHTEHLLTASDFPHPPNQLALSVSAQYVWAKFPDKERKLFLFDLSSSPSLNYPTSVDYTPLGDVKFVFPCAEKNKATVVSSAGEIASVAPSPLNPTTLSLTRPQITLPNPPIFAQRAASSDTILLTTDRTVHFYFPKAASLKSWTLPSAPISASIHPDGMLAEIETLDGTVFTVHAQLDEPRILTTIPERYNSPNGTSISRNLQHMAILHGHSLFRYALSPNPPQPNLFAVLNGPTKKIAFLPDNSTVAVLPAEGSYVTFVDSQPGGLPSRTLRFPSPPDSLYSNQNGFSILKLANNSLSWINPTIPIHAPLPDIPANPALSPNADFSAFVSFSAKTNSIVTSRFALPTPSPVLSTTIMPRNDPETTFYFEDDTLSITSPQLLHFRLDENLQPVPDSTPENSSECHHYKGLLRYPDTAPPDQWVELDCIPGKKLSLKYHPENQSLELVSPDHAWETKSFAPLASGSIIDSRQVLLVTNDKRFYYMSDSHGEESKAFYLHIPATPLCYAHNNSGLYVFLFKDGSIRFWHPAFGQTPSLPLPAPAQTFSVALSDSYMFFLTRDGRILRHAIPPVPSPDSPTPWMSAFPVKVPPQEHSPFALWAKSALDNNSPHRN